MWVAMAVHHLLPYQLPDTCLIQQLVLEIKLENSCTEENRMMLCNCTGYLDDILGPQQDMTPTPNSWK
jgi:hypothetical protein